MRLIDADALWMVTEGDHDFFERFEIDNAPTVDAVEVVRCKDCQHYEDNRCSLLEYFFHKEDDYCSWGGRRED